MWDDSTLTESETSDLPMLFLFQSEEFLYFLETRMFSLIHTRNCFPNTNTNTQGNKHGIKFYKSIILTNF